jgi:hypothetical protein
MLATSAGEWVHCGRVFSATEIAELCATVAWLPGLARKELAATVCEHLGWTTLTGTAKISACLDFLERLQAAGLLVLPALRPSPPRRCAPPSASAAPVAPVAEPAVHCALSALAPVSLAVVRDATRVAQWDALVARWHPLGFQGAFGYRLRYFIKAGEPTARLRPAVRCCARGGRARQLDRLDGSGPPRERGAGGQQQPLADLSARPRAPSGQSCARATRAPRARRLAGTLGFRAPVAGDLRRSASLCRHLLPCRRLAVAWGKQRARAGPPGPVLSQHAPPGVGQALTSDCRHRLCAAPGSPRS